MRRDPVRVACWIVLAFGLVIPPVAIAGQNVVVVLDDSGSMYDPMGANGSVRRIDAAKQALVMVLEQLPDETQLGVVALNTRGPAGAWMIPLGPLDRQRAATAIQQVDASGGTPLGSVLKSAADALLELRARQQYGDYRLLIVTDGEAQDSDLVELYLPQILQRNITVDVIGVSMSQDHSLATRVDRYRRADDVQALSEALEESLAETIDDVQDAASQNDFELLEGLTDEMAIAAIETLTRTDNRPLADRDEWDGVDELPYPSSGGATSGNAANGAPTAPGGDDEPPNRKVVPMAALGILIFIMVVLKTVTRANRGRR